MSYLREIMQRLNERLASEAGSTADPAQAGAEPIHRAEPDADASGESTQPLLGLHARHYGERLRECTPAMLQYEALWLEQHLEALELCRVQPEMLQVTGGRRHLEAMLAETRSFQTLLSAEMGRRGLTADPHHHTVVASEHAWELTHPGIRRQWGID